MHAQPSAASAAQAVTEQPVPADSCEDLEEDAYLLSSEVDWGPEEVDGYGVKGRQHA